MGSRLAPQSQTPVDDAANGAHSKGEQAMASATRPKNKTRNERDSNRPTSPKPRDKQHPGRTPGDDGDAGKRNEDGKHGGKNRHSSKTD